MYPRHRRSPPNSRVPARRKPAPDGEEHGYRERQQQAVGFRQSVTPGAPRDQPECRKENRSKHAELGGDEFQALADVNQRPAPPRVVGGMRKCCKAVGEVPGHVRGDQQRADREAGPQPRIGQHASGRRRGGQIDGHERGEKDHRVLGIETEAEPQAQQDSRPPTVLVLQQGDEAQEASAQQVSSGALGRNDPGRERHAGQRSKGQGRPESRPTRRRAVGQSERSSSQSPYAAGAQAAARRRSISPQTRRRPPR